MTTPEYRAGIETLASARDALRVFEELALDLASFPGSAPCRTLLLCVKDQIHARKLLVMEVAERCRREGEPVGVKRGGWGT